MNTSQVFLRYFQSDDDANEIEGTSRFISFSDIDAYGCPIDDEGNDLDNDQLVYFKVSDKLDKYEVIKCEF
jgi:hypothetical protein